MYFKSIQLLRAVAALYVTLFHVLYWWNQKQDAFNGIFDRGNGAIDLFFVISGFVVFQSAFKFPNGVRGFFSFITKRLARIYPIYWIFLTLFLAIGISRMPDDGWMQFVRTILLMPGHVPIITATWTLQYEIYFYLLIGLYVLNKQSKFLLGILFLGSLIAFITNLPGMGQIHLPVKGFYNEFVLEFFLGVIAFQVFKSISVMLSILLVIGGVGLFFFPVLPGSSPIISFGLPSAFLLTGLANLEFHKKIKIPAFVVLAGDASYCLYLIHIPILYSILPFPATNPPTSRGIVMVLVALVWVLAILLHLYLEKPLLTFLNNRFFNTFTSMQKKAKGETHA